MTIRYNDWQVTQRHAELVDELKPSSLRPAQVHQSIPGVVGKRINDSLREGTYLMPLGSEIGMVFSDLHDVNRRTLLVAAIGKTTTQSRDTPSLMLLAEALRTAFADRRVVAMPGELYSSHDVAGYEIDDSLARRMDVIQIVLTTRFREDR